ncbi:MAG: hypothetical protein P4M08_11150 [Oligoflexia bacterium]|nr:hypothetical protein [Oligoflexia bacterium]
MFLVFGCVACGGAQGQSQSLGAFGTQVNQFVADASSHGVSVDTSNLVVQVGDLSSASTTTVVNGVTETTTNVDVGQCDFTEAGPTVTISATAIQSFGPESLEALVYHELGHCLLKLEHNSNLSADGTPASLMYPTGVDGQTYLKNRAAYLDELFSQPQNTAFVGGG